MTRSILFLGSQMAIGGAQRVLLQQAHWFQSRGYRVVAAFLYDKEGFEAQWREEHDIPLVNLHARKHGAGWLKNAWLLLGGLWRAWRLMRKERFDAIETFTHHSNFLVVIAWLAGIPVRVATNQGHILGFPRWMEHLHAGVINLGFATHLVAVSERVRTESIQQGARPEKICIIHNGTNMPEPAQFDKAAYRCSLGIPQDAPLVLSVGRLTDQKAHTFLVQAAPAVLEHFPDTVFAVAGDGELWDALQGEIRQLKLEDHFRLLGARGDIPFLLSVADIFALPSRWEGLPIALLEAMNMGLPAVATAVEGVEEVIEHGQNGLLIPLENAHALGNALSDLLSNKEMRQRIATAGKAHVRDRYSLERMCQGYQRLLNPGSESDQEITF